MNAALQRPEPAGRLPLWPGDPVTIPVPVSGRGRSQRSPPTAMSRESVQVTPPQAATPPGLALDTRPLLPQTSKLSTAASWLLHSIWHPDSCLVLPDRALCPLSLPVYENHYIPSVHVGR